VPRPATTGLPPAGRAAVAAVGTVTAAALRLGSRLRGSKVFHPEGVVHFATVTISGGDPAPPSAIILREPGEYPAMIRFSRAIGLPRSVPDIAGLALRLVDVHGPGRHQDFLLVSSGDGPLVHHLLLPTRNPRALPYSSLVPYRAGDDTFLVGARASRDGFDLAIAPVGGKLRPVGHITVGERLPAEANRIRFNPWNTGGGIEPTGLINRLRDYAYPASQKGWAGAPAESLTLSPPPARTEARQAAP
jgi:hypothetical protein